MSRDNSSVNRSTKSRSRYRGMVKLSQNNNLISKGIDSSYSMTHSDSSDSTLSVRQYSMSEGSLPHRSAISRPDDSSSTEYHVDVDKFSELVDSIKPYWNTKVSELPSKMFDTFSAIKLLIANAGSTQNHVILLSIVDQAMRDINYSDIVPDTVAAKLIGCTIPSCEGIPIGCSQLCAGSISRPDGAKCEYPVYLYNGESFVTLTYGSTNPSEKAYVYVRKDFKSFTQSAIDALKRNGIREVLIIHLSDNMSTCSSVASEFVSLDMLLNPQRTTIANNKLSSQKLKQQQDYTIETNSASSWWWWILIVLILAVIVGLCIYFARQYKMYPSKSGVEKEASVGTDWAGAFSYGGLANITPTIGEFDYIGGMRPYSR